MKERSNAPPPADFSRARILLVGETPHWDEIRAWLPARHEQWEVSQETFGDSVLAAMAREEYEIYLIDCASETGIQFLSRAAAVCAAPLIGLLAKCDASAGENLICAGADDWLCAEELSAESVGQTLRKSFVRRAGRRDFSPRDAILLASIEHADAGLFLMQPRAPGSLDSLRVTYVNATFSRITCYEKSEVLGGPMPQFFMGQFATEASHRLDVAVAAGDSIQITQLCKRRDETSFWGEFRLLPVRDAAQFIVGSIGILRDVSERVAMEKRARGASKPRSGAGSGSSGIVELGLVR